MYQITTEEIDEEIINSLIPQEIILREKLIRKINESYQWNAECYQKTLKGEYSFITKLLEAHLFHFC